MRGRGGEGRRAHSFVAWLAVLSAGSVALGTASGERVLSQPGPTQLTFH